MALVVAQQQWPLPWCVEDTPLMSSGQTPVQPLSATFQTRRGCLPFVAWCACMAPAGVGPGIRWTAEQAQRCYKTCCLNFS
jgi:hypothetical protein